MTDEKLNKILEDSSSKLMEHFDTIRIFATKHENNETLSYSIGKGNLFAQIKQIEYWVQDINADTVETVSDEDEEVNYHK